MESRIERQNEVDSPCEDFVPREKIANREIMFMVTQLSRIFHYEMRKVCEDNGVPASYRGVLLHLARNNGCNQRTLAEKTGLRPSTVSITLEKMEREGYIERKRNEIDQRVVHVFLTAKGLQIDEANRARIKELEERCSMAVTPEEKEVLIGLLEKVKDGYCAAQGWDGMPSCGRNRKRRKG